MSCDVLEPCAAGQEELKIQGGFLSAQRLDGDAGEARVFPDRSGDSREGQAAWTRCLHVLFLTQLPESVFVFTLTKARDIVQRQAEVLRI